MFLVMGVRLSCFRLSWVSSKNRGQNTEFSNISNYCVLTPVLF